MSRRSNRRSRNAGRRDNFPIANTYLPPRPSLVLPAFKPVGRTLVKLRVIEDRRLYSPLPSSPRTMSTRPAKIVHAPVPSRPRRDLLFSPTFQNPLRVVICVRRKQRKEVLHALGKSGRSGQKKPRRNQWSDVRC